jgi:serine/threonine protein kinase
VSDTSSVSNVAGALLAPGTTVAGYRIEALIGRGGMGAVYRGHEEGLGRKVALKVIAPELAQDQRFRERFLRESRIAASLDHPHVIPIYQAGEQDGVLFLAMRYVEGSDLAKVVAEEGALEPRRAVDLLSQIAEALDAAHEKGLVHRDVKPSNVLIAVSAGREHCYLGDFGLTKRTGSLSGVSVAGEIVGTLEYVAPEQITGDPVDERSDVYALGCVLYECLTGQSPFPRATDVALLWAHVHEEPTPPSQARLDLPKELDTVLTRALAKEPGRRYRSAGELLAATRSALRLVDAAPTPRTTSRRRLVVAGAAAAATLVLAAVLGFALLGGSGSLSSVAPNSVGVIDPGSNQLVAEVPAGRAPQAIATGLGGVWVANVDDEIVLRIDPADLEARAIPISVPEYPSDLTTGGGYVLVALGALAELVRINTEQNEAASPIDALGDDGTPCGRPQASITFGDGVAWFVCEVGLIGRVNVRTGKSLDIGLASGLIVSSESASPAFSDVAFGLGSLWILNRNTNQVAELDPLTNLGQYKYTVGDEPAAIAVGTDSLWVANFEDDTVTRIAFTGGIAQPPTISTITVGDGPLDVAVADGAVWVVNQLDATVTRIDEDSGDVITTIEIGNNPQRVAAGEGFVWVTVRAPEQEFLESDTTGP